MNVAMGRRHRGWHMCGSGPGRPAVRWAKASDPLGRCCCWWWWRFVVCCLWRYVFISSRCLSIVSLRSIYTVEALFLLLFSLHQRHTTIRMHCRECGRRCICTPVSGAFLLRFSGWLYYRVTRWVPLLIFVVKMTPNWWGIIHSSSKCFL